MLLYTLSHSLVSNIYSRALELGLFPYQKGKTPSAHLGLYLQYIFTFVTPFSEFGIQAVCLCFYEQ